MNATETPAAPLPAAAPPSDRFALLLTVLSALTSLVANAATIWACCH